MNTALHPTARAVFEFLPPGFKRAFLDCPNLSEPDELLEELALAALEGRTPAQARSAARRFMEGGQAPRRMASIDVMLEQGIEVANLMPSHPPEDRQPEPELAGVPLDTDQIARQHGVSRRRAQQILKFQAARAASCGDLWVDTEDPPREKETPHAGRLMGRRVGNPMRKVNENSVAGRWSGREGGA